MSYTNPNSLGWADLRRADGDPRPPGPLVVSLAFAVLLAWVGLGSVLDVRQSVLIVGVLVIAAVSSWWLTVPTALALGVVAFLVLDGFVQNSLGQLSWDGLSDGVLAMALLTLPALSAELGFEVLTGRRRHRAVVEARHPRDAEVDW